jgi:hypothetical protein
MTPNFWPGFVAGMLLTLAAVTVAVLYTGRKM